MKLPEELWQLIKRNMFHNIKYGKHTLNNKDIIEYNQTIKNIPKKTKQQACGGYCRRLTNDFYYFEKYFVKINENKFLEIFEHQKL
jgi:hypothetical protein